MDKRAPLALAVILLSSAQALASPQADAEAYPALRCAGEGICVTHAEPGVLFGACRVADAEVTFDVFVHRQSPPQLDPSALRWSDWCGRVVDQDGATVTAVYGNESCLDAWEPDWRERLVDGRLRGAPTSTRQTDPVFLDCLGKLMDDAKARSQRSEWLILHALVHATVLACL